MNNIEVFQDQIDRTDRITAERVEEIVSLVKENVDDERTEEQIREQWPVGDKKLYAVVVADILDPSDDQGEKMIKSINIVSVLESEIDDWVEQNNLVYTDTNVHMLPRFKVRDQ